MTVTAQNQTHVFVDADGRRVCTDGSFRLTWTERLATVDLGSRGPEHRTGTTTYDATHGVFDLVRAACTWEGEGREVAEQAVVNMVTLLGDVKELQVGHRAVLTGREQAVREALAEYQGTLRVALLEAWEGHRAHISADALNEFLRSVGLETEPIEFTVRVRETAQRWGTVTVEADDEDAAAAEAYRIWESGSSDISWDDEWEDRDSDRYDYEVEEA